MTNLRLFWRYVALSVRAQMQYRADLWMRLVGQAMSSGLDILALVVMFGRFGNLRGWTLPEVALCYGIVGMGFSFADAICTGFDMFGQTVKSGDFDRILLRPRNAALQLAGQEFALRRFGRFLQAAAPLAWAIAVLPLAWTPAKVALLVAAVAGGACLFSGLLVLQATLAFWTVESLEIMNTVTYGGIETAQYPLAIYRPWFRRFFTAVVPLAFISYYPVLAILGRQDNWGMPPAACWLSPLAGAAFLALALQVWKVGVRHYCSTGS